MLLVVEKRPRGGICQAMHRYDKANNKYMKNCDKDIISSYLAYLDPNNLYGWALSQTLPVNGFKGVKSLSTFNEIFIRNYDENSDEGYILKVDVDYPKKLVNKVKNLICNIEAEEKYVMHIKSLKARLKSWISI